MKTSLTRALAQTVDGPSARPGRWLLGVWSVGELLAGFFSADPPGHWNEPPQDGSGRSITLPGAPPMMSSRANGTVR